MSDPRIPDKLYFKIGEVAEILGVKPSVLRYWETEFRSVRPEKSKTNQRQYARRHVERLLQIKELLYDQRFTIAGARRRLREGPPDGAPETPPAPAKQLGLDLDGRAKKVLAQVKKELQELLQLLDE